MVKVKLRSERCDSGVWGLGAINLIRPAENGHHSLCL